MGWFRKKEAEVLRRGAEGVTEERKSFIFGGQKVEVRRVTEAKAPAHNRKNDRRGPAKPVRESRSQAVPAGGVSKRKSLLLPNPGASRCSSGCCPTRPRWWCWRVRCSSSITWPVRTDPRWSATSISARCATFSPGWKRPSSISDPTRTASSTPATSRARLSAQRPPCTDRRGTCRGEEVLVQVAKDAMGAKGVTVPGSLRCPTRTSRPLGARAAG